MTGEWEFFGLPKNQVQDCDEAVVGFVSQAGYVAWLAGYVTRLAGYVTRLAGYVAWLTGYVAYSAEGSRRHCQG
jgi:hypothetical protein